jgi:hypothetical protein
MKKRASMQMSLAAIEEEEPDLEAEALVAAETDVEADEDNLPDEDWTDDLPGRRCGRKRMMSMRDKEGNIQLAKGNWQ